MDKAKIRRTIRPVEPYISIAIIITMIYSLFSGKWWGFIGSVVLAFTVAGFRWWVRWDSLKPYMENGVKYFISKNEYNKRMKAKKKSLKGKQ